jgi:hypothetical protein
VLRGGASCAEILDWILEFDSGLTGVRGIASSRLDDVAADAFLRENLGKDASRGRW